MLTEKDFRLTKEIGPIPSKTEPESPPRIKDDEFGLSKLNSFRQVCYFGEYGVWKSGNIYLKNDKDILHQNFVGQKINELKCPIFFQTLGVLSTRYYPVSVENYFDYKYHDLPIILANTETERDFLLTLDAGDLDYERLFVDELDNMNLERVEKILLSIFVQLVTALRYAYLSYNFSHGDLHSENIKFKKYTGWVKIGEEYVYSHGYMPIIIDFGSSFMKIGNEIHRPFSVESVIADNNHLDRPNNIGDIFRVFYSLFMVAEVENLQIQKIRDYLIPPDFNAGKISNLCKDRENYWFTPKNDTFDFNHFYQFIRENYEEHFASSSLVEKEKLLFEKQVPFLAETRETDELENFIIKNSKFLPGFLKVLDHALNGKYPEIKEKVLKIIEKTF